LAVPEDDFDISSTAVVCFSRHDNAPETDHMSLYGASFEATDSIR
jgi:hypothetical protein